MKLNYSKILFLFVILLKADFLLAVGGYSQTIIVNNKTKHNLNLVCKGGFKEYREKTISVPPHKATFFLSAFLEDLFDHLLGGDYQCEISVGGIRNKEFSLKLSNAQEIAVWTVLPAIKRNGIIKCAHESFRSFKRPSEIRDRLNKGKKYKGSKCRSIEI